MSDIDINKFLSFYKDIPTRPNHSLYPPHPYRLLMYGPSGCGKTYQLMDILMNRKIYFDKLYIFAKDLEENKYRALDDYFSKILPEQMNLDEPILVTKSSDLADVPNPDSLDRKKQHLFVFDDMVTEKETSQKLIKDFFVRGRKVNAAIIYITQSYFNVPKIIRDNLSHLVLFGANSRTELKRIAREWATGIEVQEFMKIYDSCIAKNHGYMVVDRNNEILCMRFRRGWDEICTHLIDKMITDG